MPRLRADDLEVNKTVEGPRVARDGPPWRCYGPMLTHSRSDGDFPIYTRGERVFLLSTISSL